MKRLAAGLLALTISLTSLTFSFADYKEEYANIYTSLYGDIISTLELPREDQNADIAKLKLEVFKYQYTVLYELITTTLIDKDKDTIAKELTALYRNELGIGAKDPLPKAMSATELTKLMTTEVDKRIKLVESMQDEASKAKELKSHMSMFQYVQTTLLTIQNDLSRVLASTKQYNGVSTISLTQATIDKFIATKIDITGKLAPYAVTTQNGVIVYNLDVEFDAANLRASIYDETTEALTNSYLEALAITSTLEPFMSVPSDMLLYPDISDKTKQLIKAFGKRRKPLYIATSSSAFDDYKADKEMAVTPARLSHLTANKKDEKILFFRNGNDEIIQDTNTVAPVTPAPTPPATGTGTAATPAPPVAATPSPPTEEDRALAAPVYVSANNREGIVDSFTKPFKRVQSDSSLLESTNVATNFTFLNNLLTDTVIKSDENNSLLFIDIFGNVVTEEDTVVIPGIANATLYEPAGTYPLTTKFAFNHYSNPEDEAIKAVMDLDNGDAKIGLKYDPDGGVFTTYTMTPQSNDIMKKLAGWTKSQGFSGNSRVLMRLTTELFYDTSVAGKPINLFNTEDKSMWSDNPTVQKLNKSLTLSGIDQTVIGLSYFESDDATSSLLTKSHMNALQSGTLSIRHNKIADMATEVAKGKNTMADYKLELASEEEAVSIFKTLLRSIVSPLLTICNKVTGFTHLGDPATHPITKYIVEYREIITALSIMCGLFLLLSMYNSKAGLPLTIIATTLFVGVFAIGIDMIIDYTITGYNKVVSIDLPLIRDDASLYRTIGLAEEQRYRRDDKKPPSETSTTEKDYTVKDSLSLTLAKYDREFSTTKLIPLDLGMYMEGRSVKISTADLFSTVSIVDNDYVENGEIKRDVTIYKNYDTFNIENYTIFYDLVEHLTKQMTTYSSIAEPKPKAIRYSNVTSKKAYIWRSLADSVLVLDYEELFELDIPDAVKQKAQNTFPPNDTLNLNNIEIKVYENDENRTPTKGVLSDLTSLPYNSEFLLNLHKHYDKYPDVYQANYDKFVIDANMKVKDYLIKNYDTISRVSDETATKIISLIIMEEFANSMTNPIAGQYVYPTYIDSSKLSLEKILFATIDDLSWYNLGTLSLIDAMDSMGSGAGYIFLMITLPVIGLCIFMLSLFPFILMALLFIMLFVRVIFRQNVTSLLTGATKMLSLALLLCFITSKSMMLITGLIPKLVFLAIVSLLVLDVMIVMYKALLTNLLDLGNGTLGASLLGTKSAGVYSKFTNKSKQTNKDPENHFEPYKTAEYNSGASYTDKVMRRFGHKM